MIDQSSIDLLQLIPGTFKRAASTAGGEYKGACPKCHGTDRFMIQPKAGRWFCRGCNTGGDAIAWVMHNDGLPFTDAVHKLGLESQLDATTDERKESALDLSLAPETPALPTIPAPAPPAAPAPQADKPWLSTKRAYTGLQDYAAAHGLDAEDLEACNWYETTHTHKGVERPALAFPTKGGTRYRLIDGEEPRYLHQTGYQSSWYGLNDLVIENARKNFSPLWLCNGEISTIAARFWGVPAISVAGGSERAIPDNLLRELLDTWNGRVAIVMDCDSHGRKAAQTIVAQFPANKAVIVDLGLGEGQDLADYVKRHGSHSLKRLKNLIPRPKHEPVGMRQAARFVVDSLDIESPVNGKPIVMPFRIYHHLQGYAQTSMPGKITAIVALSGHGKTSHISTANDTLNRLGENGVGLLPEFDEEEYHWDRLQRYSAAAADGRPLVTVDDMIAWKMWRAEHQNNIPEQVRHGRALSQEQKAEVRRVSEWIESWRGEFTLHKPSRDLRDDLKLMGEDILQQRAAGKSVTYAVFDYLQILRALGADDSDNVYEYTLGLIKDFTIDYSIHGYVSSQVNKLSDKANREQTKVLGTSDARYMRDDKINLFITLNWVYQDSIANEFGIVEQQTLTLADGKVAGIANIAKNTKGRTGYVRQIFDGQRLTWLDQTYNLTSVNLLDD